MNDHYEYPSELFCIKCEDDVEPVIEDRMEPMVKGDESIEVPYKAAICPKCGSVLCDRDLDYAIIRIARKDGFL